MVLRRTASDMLGAVPLFRALSGADLAILRCLPLPFSLPSSTIVRFCFWNAIGLAIHFADSRQRSLLKTV
ncbi:hypothetical protein [Sphingomonas sp. RS2018]